MVASRTGRAARSASTSPSRSPEQIVAPVNVADRIDAMPVGDGRRLLPGGRRLLQEGPHDPQRLTAAASAR